MHITNVTTPSGAHWQISGHRKVRQVLVGPGLVELPKIAVYKIFWAFETMVVKAFLKIRLRTLKVWYILIYRAFDVALFAIGLRNLPGFPRPHEYHVPW